MRQLLVALGWLEPPLTARLCWLCLPWCGFRWSGWREQRREELARDKECQRFGVEKEAALRSTMQRSRARLRCWMAVCQLVM